MASEWRSSNWGDEVTLEYGKAIRGYNQAYGRYRVFGSNGPIGWTADALTQGPGVILGRKGAYRGVEFCREPFWVIDTAYYVVPKNDLDVRWLYYAIKHYKLGEVDDGSPIPSTTRAAVYMLELDVPPKHEQRAIAHILGTLDDKIELNRKQNETLEAMARTLFRAWFVDFEPVRAKLEGRWQRGLSLPGLPAHLYDLFPNRLVESELGKIPEGWEVKTIGDFVTIKRGSSPRPIQDFIRSSGIPWVKISDATSSTSRFLFQTKEFIKQEGLKKTVFLQNGELILSNSATPGLPIFLELDACIHDGWLYFPQKHTLNDLYLYQLFLEIRDELVAQGNGSVFTNLKTDILRYQKIVVASEALFRGFDNLAKPLFNKLLALNRESRSLAQLRDTLLPKLISGELRVRDAEQFVARTAA